MLDIRLKTFIVLARIKNYTKAAEILNITQPAVSQHIKYLEDYYGNQLLKKSGRGFELTEEGSILLKFGEEIEMLYRSLELELKNKSGIKKSYNIGATMTIGGYVLPGILAKYKKTIKNITLLLQVNNTQEIIDKLISRKLNFAFVEGPFDKAKFKYRRFREDELVLAVSPEHDFARKSEVDLRDVLSGNLILREKGSGTRKIFENKLADLGFNIQETKVYMEIGSISAIKSLVESNLGYTIISRETIKREIGLGTIHIVPIKNLNITREFNLIYLDENEEKFIEEFIDFCNKSIDS